MFPHHQSTIERVSEAFQAQPGVEAVILGGSIAHGFAREDSDVDILIVVSDEEHSRRVDAGEFHYYSTEFCDYPEGYVDGKYLSPSFLDQVEQIGSEPARYAFADARVLFSDFDGLSEQVRRIARYPGEEKTDRICRFHAQLAGWRWYAGEAEKRGNQYLMATATAKMLLFGGRMILAHNETLYPFHKWFFRVLERVPQKPDGLMDAMRALSAHATLENAILFHDLVLQYREWENDGTPWPNRFIADSELTWLRRAAAIEEI
ncbi:hypothetical protein CCAX7_56680 [Capsulimonas corticalis]|uniref:Uncharacterized protein n=1 Tax=Capsulimonas corticalis TaxID=2219043 RepID=A0A402D0F1_9BACT|nr:nucleotidyltransferase domain-containing protein [Capsulimonas corticalis]BDI33617.1 hypothetical protein CCAX7_56680 [Capsulimonas corticalis]